ncbi:MAG: phosphate/phosphite/phosphonate ABC transporter substrate-binding protein [Acidiferrobacterales bacterium]
MLASLPMYDLPEMRTATNAWWKGLAAALRRAGVDGVPDRLTHTDDSETLWHHPNLLFSQACGYPFTHPLPNVLQPVATPVYDAPGCLGPRYCSAIVIGADHPVSSLQELRGGVCAVNGRNSHSGYNCLRATLAPLANGGRFFSQVIESGAHANSLALVASSEVDVCAIDCVTHALIARYRPQTLAGTRVLAYTQLVPATPYVTRAGADPDLVSRLQDGLMTALADPQLADAREALLLVSAEPLSVDDYDVILQMEDAARGKGYPEIV